MSGTLIVTHPSYAFDEMKDHMGRAVHALSQRYEVVSLRKNLNYPNPLTPLTPQEFESDHGELGRSMKRHFQDKGEGVFAGGYLGQCHYSTFRDATQAMLSERDEADAYFPIDGVFVAVQPDGIWFDSGSPIEIPSDLAVHLSRRCQQATLEQVLAVLPELPDGCLHHLTTTYTPELTARPVEIKFLYQDEVLATTKSKSILRRGGKQVRVHLMSSDEILEH